MNDFFKSLVNICPVCINRFFDYHLFILFYALWNTSHISHLSLKNQYIYIVWSTFVCNCISSPQTWQYHTHNNENYTDVLHYHTTISTHIGLMEGCHHKFLRTPENGHLPIHTHAVLGCMWVYKLNVLTSDISRWFERICVYTPNISLYNEEQASKQTTPDEHIDPIYWPHET